MPVGRASLQVEEPSRARPAPSGGVEKWKIAAGGGIIGLILVIVIVVKAQGKGGGPGDGGGDDAGGGDDVVVDPVVNVDAQQIIWTYHDGELKPYQELCKETIEKHRGDFKFNFLNSKDDVLQHISEEDLPKDWDDLKPRYKRDTAINALLARHGGVALDINTIMFRTLNEWWRLLEKNDVAFKGFYYKSRSETATWFMMVGDKGTSIMQTAVERQKKLSGNEPAGCMEKDKKAHLCYGSSVVSYALCTYSSEYCKCYMSETEGCELSNITTKESDAVYDLTDPRKTVQSELATPNKQPKEDMWEPMASTFIEDVNSRTEGWQKFLRRFDDEEPFITLQAPTSKIEELASMSRADLLNADSAGDTYFYMWLCLAKHKGTTQDC